MLESQSKKFAEGGEITPEYSFKTPTNEKTKLNYLQQVLVRTKGFKQFFGDWELAAEKFLSDGILKQQLELINYKFDDKSIVVNHVENRDNVNNIIKSVGPKYRLPPL